MAQLTDRLPFAPLTHKELNTRVADVNSRAGALASNAARADLLDSWDRTQLLRIGRERNQWLDAALVRCKAVSS